MTTTTTQIIQAFAFDDHLLRVVRKGVDISDTPAMESEIPTPSGWFVAKDICQCLGIKNYRDAITRLDDDERGVQTLDTPGGAQQMSVISESGMYTLILRSNGATTPGTRVHRFRKWVTSEVLPAIRQTGRYTAPSTAASSLDAEQLGRLFTSMEQLVTLMPRVLGVMEQMLSAMPKMLEATHPQRGKPSRKRMHVEDVGRIQALRDKGYTLDELVAETEFSQSQCWSVISGRYKVLESGRVSIDLRSDAARAADATAKAERAAVQPGLLSD